MKEALRETQTLRAGCSKAEPKIFAPPRDGQSLKSAGDGHYLYLQTQFGEDLSLFVLTAIFQVNLG